MTQFLQPGVALAGRAAADGENVFDIGIEQALAQHTLPDHSGRAEQHDFEFAATHTSKPFGIASASASEAASDLTAS